MTEINPELYYELLEQIASKLDLNTCVMHTSPNYIGDYKGFKGWLSDEWKINTEEWQKIILKKYLRKS
jgi:hypothetical protein